MGTKEDKRDKEKTKRTESGKYFYDLSKSTFSITALGNLALIFKDGTVTMATAIGTATGLMLTALFYLIGSKVLNK